MTAADILAAVRSPAELLAGRDAAIAESQAANAAARVACRAAEDAQRRAEEAIHRARLWCQAVERLYATLQLMDAMKESN